MTKRFFPKRNFFSPTAYRPPFLASVYEDLAPWNSDNSSSLMASFSGLKVEAYPGENPEALIRRFKKMVERAGVLGELKKREYYRSPGQKARERKKEAIKNSRIRKAEAEAEASNLTGYLD